MKNEWVLQDLDETRSTRKRFIFAISAVLILLSIIAFSLGVMNLVVFSLIGVALLFLIQLPITKIFLNRKIERTGHWYLSHLHLHVKINGIYIKDEDLLVFLRKLLKEQGLSFEEKTHLLLSTTFFNIRRPDFRISLRSYSPGATTIMRMAEVGFGPETPSNKKTLLKLRTKLSQELAKKYL